MADGTYTDPLGGFGDSGTGFDTTTTFDATGGVDPSTLPGSDPALDTASATTDTLPTDTWNNSYIDSINGIAGVTDPTPAPDVTNPAPSLIDYANGGGAGPSQYDPNAGSAPTSSGLNLFGDALSALSNFGSAFAHLGSSGSPNMQSSAATTSHVPVSGRTATGFIGSPNGTHTVLIVILVGVMVFALVKMRG